MAQINLSELRDKCLKNLYSCVENIPKYVQDDDEKKAELDKLRHCVQEYCKMEQQEQAATKVISSLENESGFEDFQSLDEQYKSKMAQQNKKRAKFDNHTFMVDFEKHKREAEAVAEQDVDSDLAITKTITTYIDPMSKKQITNPVKNKICKHVYDKETADRIVSNTRNKGCPCFGCNNKQTMLHDHLEVDHELQLTLQTMQATAAASQDMDD